MHVKTVELSDGTVVLVMDAATADTLRVTLRPSARPKNDAVVRNNAGDTYWDVVDAVWNALHDVTTRGQEVGVRPQTV